MLSARYRLDEPTQLLLQEACAAKQAYLRDHLQHLALNTSPSMIWSKILKYRYHPTTPSDNKTNKHENENNATVESYNELQLTYDGFRGVAYEILFHLSPDEDARGPPDERAARRQLFFAHPFLSPAIFLAFRRSQWETVPAVPLYAFAAKRLLLFRLRAGLEVVASVPPPLLRPRGPLATAGQRLLTPSAPCFSSPLSNGLNEKDLERFLAGLLPHLKLVRDMVPWLRPYYLCHAVRKFMFMVDPQGRGVLAIDALMRSEVFSEFLQLFESDPADAVLAFPVGAVVEIEARWAAGPAAQPDVFPAQAGPSGERKSGTASSSSADAASGAGPPREETIHAIVEEFDHDGVELTDRYLLRLVEADVLREVPRAEIYFSAEAVDAYAGEGANLENWFAFPLMFRIYEHFIALDQDEDGVLTVEELSHYSEDSFTRLVIERVFECHVPHTGERHLMDYKTYLNFVIATEHAGTRPALKYLWKVLDLDGTVSHIRVSTLYCFCKEIARELVQRGLMGGNLSANLILSEIVDMINPKWHEWITFEDLEKSGQQVTVLPILLSYKNFLLYDSRENIATTATENYLAVKQTTV